MFSPKITCDLGFARQATTLALTDKTPMFIETCPALSSLLNDIVIVNREFIVGMYIVKGMESFNFS